MQRKSKLQRTQEKKTQVEAQIIEIQRLKDEISQLRINEAMLEKNLQILISKIEDNNKRTESLENKYTKNEIQTLNDNIQEQIWKLKIIFHGDMGKIKEEVKSNKKEIESIIANQQKSIWQKLKDKMKGCIYV